MKKLLFPMLLAGLLLSSGGLMAQEKSESDAPPGVDKRAAAAPSAASDEASIRKSAAEFAEAFNRGDADAIAAQWTEQGEYIDDAGHRFEGRDAIKQQYSAIFDERGDSKIRVLVDSVKLLSDSAAIEDGRTLIEPPPAGAPATSKYTAVHVKHDGKWLLSSVRTTSVEGASTYRHLEDLEWLIGSWTADQNGATSKVTCEWLGNKSFVQRKYVVSLADGTESSGLQLIGWNADLGVIQSWNFSADGGHAIGVWTPHASGWSIETHGVLGDGTPTSATNVFTKLDENGCTWQSFDRVAGETALPDTEEVVLKREAAKH